MSGDILDTFQAIAQRRTTKMLASQPAPESDVVDLEGLMALAGMAPFHRACDESHRNNQPPQANSLDGIEPWRFHVLRSGQCRELRERLPRENAGKIPAMLAAADVLVLATWLPNPISTENPSRELLFEPTLGNMEHIAAAAAAIQNLLLAATAKGIASYWSSGGVLRSASVFELLQIPAREILLGAVFLFPQEISKEASPDAMVEVVGSKLRDRRTQAPHWSRMVQLR